ncbi:MULTISPECIES: flagellar hook-associated protein FlgK [unclassified Cupriavidus]|uniref:flagellar hook-associated protein FlgK n=1 Tax=unclassified Cupriavidus TaxID=2640874 RepID=UPI001C0072ED|nr:MULTISPECIES: flagellar hook-associated protein FlgK [unclassified Cupriavidus]MCA3183987.1 flagellar hook-associated protein FlgK [Cupriavidus sp.]MCA3191801.1 flagellar hook-associated protein FlgK [Cupriavidus sp.]MCA3198031.1 flagellar hook-associated protein FlgK [Cupriavidus sp.]MCA3200715.1 flagellar hook-associated protein FlgK [Cupriavidus sp.]MCA3207750.1 flagellar hook-associated protein FlgK [Cupriavidus sp.]
MSLFNIGLSGLNVAQNGLTTVGHNFSNAATAGYTRQNTIIASAGGQATGSGFYGQGSNTITVQRVYDGFLTGQLRGATSASYDLSTYSDQIRQIDNLLADEKGGLAPLMQKFFASVQAVSDTPADPATRQGMISSAQALAGQIKSSSDYFKQLQNGINTQLQSSVTQVNDYTKQIASLNKEISRMTASAGGQPPNDLLDQRDQAVAKLTELVGAKVVVQDGGTYNVFIGNGQPLVMGSDSYDIKAVPSSADPSRTTVAYTLPNGNTVEAEEGAVTGGSIGGLLRFRTDSLDAAQNAIGRLSLAIGQTFNAQHKLGIDLNGAIGTDVFSLGSATAFANSKNTSNAVATATITNAGNLTTSDYTLKFDGTNYTLLRKSDNKVVATQPGATATYPMALAADGFSVSVNVAMGGGDSFEIQPTRNAAAGFGSLITDPAKIAAASPARADASTQNTGTVKASLTNVAPGFSLMTNPVKVTYTAGAYVIVDSVTGNPLVPAPTVTATATGTDITFNNMTFSLNGTPKNGDTFTLSNNTGAVADNGNMLKLAKLQTAKTINGTSSFNDAYAQLVNDVGSKAKSADIASASQDSITDQIYTAQQSVSGVNMDEETVNLLKFQQLYQANAKVIQAASTIFDTLVSIA